MTIRVATLIIVAVFVSDLVAEQRYVVRLADGTQFETSKVQDGHLFPTDLRNDEEQQAGASPPVRGVVKQNRAKRRWPNAYVEMIGNDILAGEVAAYSNGSEDRFDKLPPHLGVRKSTELGDGTETGIRITLDSIRRIVWHSVAEHRYQPGTVWSREGTSIPYRTLRWGETEIQILTREGLKSVPFSDIAELHLPEKDEWKCYIQQLATLMPSLDSTLIQIQTEDGNRLTGSLARFHAGQRGPQNRPDRAFQLLQPAWSLDPIVIQSDSICEWQFHQPNELPLTYFRPKAFEHQAVFGQSYTWKRDENVLGGPLRSTNREFSWGFGVHGTSELAFPIPASTKSFRTLVGLDRTVGGGGCVDVEILTDSGSTIFKRENIVGGTTVIDTNWQDLSQQSPVPKTLILRTNMAHEKRPAGADPFDVRDVVNWYEPEIRSDNGALEGEVRDQATNGIEAFAGWTISPEAARSLELRNLPDKAQPEATTFQRHIRPKEGKYRIERQVKVKPTDQFAVVLLSRQVDSSPSAIDVLINQQSCGRFDVPIRESMADPQPILIPIGAFQNQTITLQFDVHGSDDRSWMDWQGIWFTENDPGIRHLFEDDRELATVLKNESGQIEVQPDDVYSGQHALKVTSGAAENLAIPGWDAVIREHPRLGEFRYLVFAWKKMSGKSIQLQLGHAPAPPPLSKAWEIGWSTRPHPPLSDERGKRFGYCYEVGVASTSPPHPLWMQGDLPHEWQLVERDLFNDFGAFIVTGIGLRTGDSNPAWFDHIYLARTKADVERIKTLIKSR